MINVQGVAASPYYAAMFTGFKIDQAISSKSGTATFVIEGRASVLASILTPRSEVLIMGGDYWDEPNATWDDGSTVWDPVTLFGGEITRIDPKVITPLSLTGAPMTGYTQYTIQCRDYSYLLDEAVVVGSFGAGASDQTVINTLVASTAGGATVSTVLVSAITTLPAMSFQSVTLRSALDQICAITGGSYFDDYTKTLNYFLPSAADFAVSDTPNLGTTSPPSYYALMQGFQYASDGTALFNKITVIGALSGGVGSGNGNPYSSTESDATSIATYGTHSRVIVDTSLTSTAATDARALAELARSKNPAYSGTFVIRRYGLKVGRLVSVKCVGLNLNAAFIINSISIEWKNQPIPFYTISFGDYQPDIIKYLKLLTTQTKPPTVQPQAVSPANSIVPNQVNHLDAGSITVGTLDASVINVINLNASNINTGTLTVGAGGITVTGQITGTTMVLNLNGVTSSFNNAAGGSTFGIRTSLNSDTTKYSFFGPSLITCNSGTLSTDINPSSVSIADTFFGSSVGIALVAGVPQVNIGSNFALAHGTVSKKVVAGSSAFVAGVKAINTGLSAIDAVSAGIRVSGPTTETVSWSVSGATVTFNSSTGAGTSAFDYTVVGSI
jgi:hypothetical protein